MNHHAELTAELLMLLDTFDQTKYANEKEFPVTAVFARRLRDAVEKHGRKDLKVMQVGVSDEVREALYDNELAPMIDRLHEMCERYSMPLLVAVQWGGHQKMSTTTFVSKNEMPGWPMQMAMLAASSAGNIDSLFVKIGVLAKETGHNSMVLRQLGISEKPEQDEPPKSSNS